MTIKILVNGASGKMGKMACDAILETKDFELVAALSSKDHLKTVLQETTVDVAVDLTRADVAFENSRVIVESGARPVIGTSGLTRKDIDWLTHYCKTHQLGGLICPNFSISAVLMMTFAKIAAKYFSHAEIVETHHAEKYDAPSQTALYTAELMQDAKSSPFTLPHSHELEKGARGALCQSIPIHSVRLPGVVARQEIIFGSAGETLRITHESIDRLAYRKGLILAIQTVMQLHHLIEGLEHVIT